MVDFEKVESGMQLQLIGSNDKYILVTVTGKGIKEVDGIKTPLIHTVPISHPNLTISKEPSYFDYYNGKEIINDNKVRRKTHCFGCGKLNLDSMTMKVCNKCGWIICPNCGSCKCTYKGAY